MFQYEKALQYPVKIARPNAKLAKRKLLPSAKHVKKKLLPSVKPAKRKLLPSVRHAKRKLLPNARLAKRKLLLNRRRKKLLLKSNLLLTEGLPYGSPFFVIAIYHSSTKSFPPHGQLPPCSTPGKKRLRAAQR